jgi:bacillithiol biosynthesis deacetylase BshB1
MGINVRENLLISDGNIEVNQENILSLITIIRKHSPRVLIFPHATDRHPDHERAHRLCKEAWFYSGLARIETELDGTRQSPHRPAYYFNFMQWTEFEPTFIVDVSDEFSVRMEAIRAYKSQLYDPASTDQNTALSTPEFIEMIVTRAEYYGDRIGVKYGEPFYFFRTPGVSDLLSVI